MGAGILLATQIAPLIVVPLIDAIGWRPTFAFLGAVGMMLSIPLVWFLVQDEPRRDYGVSNTELAYIHTGKG